MPYESAIITNSIEHLESNKDHKLNLTIRHASVPRLKEIIWKNEYSTMRTQ